MTSTAMDSKTGDTDLKWVLCKAPITTSVNASVLTCDFEDNLRYAMSSCMWGFPGNSSVQNTVSLIVEYLVSYCTY